MKKSGLGFLPPGAFPTTDLGPSGPARAQPAVESKIYDSPSILPSHPFSLDWHPALSGNLPDGSGGVPIPRVFGGGEPVSEQAVGVLWRTEYQTAPNQGCGTTRVSLLVSLVRLEECLGRLETGDTNRMASKSISTLLALEVSWRQAPVAEIAAKPDRGDGSWESNRGPSSNCRL